MSSELAWAVKPKWHRYESARSYAQRQSAAANVPFDFVERGLTSPSQPSIDRVWNNDTAVAATIEAAAGRPEGHYQHLKHLAQPDAAQSYPERFLCRLCAAGDRVEQIPHDRENWCLKHPGQLVWVGPGTTPELQLIVPFDHELANAERRFRRLVAAGRVDARLHTRVWEMVRDNAWLTRPGGWKADLTRCLHDHEVLGRAMLYPETVAVLSALSTGGHLERWIALPSTHLRQAIVRSLPPMHAPTEVLVERIVLWLRPLRREIRPTRIEPLDIPLDIVDASTIIDTTAPYPLWIQRRPQAIAEWDWNRNDSGRDPWAPRWTSAKAWWVCDQGHSWESTPYVRAIAGCRYCAGQAAWPGQSDLATQHPHLAAEWDSTPGANAGDPDHAGARSTRRVTWVCRRDHRWVATINNRTKLGSGCPYCAGNRAIPGETDLATLRPDLAADWDQERNGTLTPNTVGAHSSRKAWWTGRCGHTWRAGINSRVKSQRCPHCSGKRSLPGVTDLATLRPDLATQWHHTNQLKPEEVRPDSSKKVTWLCPGGHLWEAPIRRRAGADPGCPYCSRKLPIPGMTDLATLRPDLANEWDPSNRCRPQDFSAHANRRAMWRCANDHAWRATISSRTRPTGGGCPYCDGQRTAPGENDLATLRPEIATEWDASNRGTPAGVKPTSRRKAAWRCAFDHLWEATVASRAQGEDCPVCRATKRT